MVCEKAWQDRHAMKARDRFICIVGVYPHAVGATVRGRESGSKAGNERSRRAGVWVRSDSSIRGIAHLGSPLDRSASGHPLGQLFPACLFQRNECLRVQPGHGGQNRGLRGRDGTEALISSRIWEAESWPVQPFNHDIFQMGSNKAERIILMASCIAKTPRSVKSGDISWR